jgi:hypothetical protein
MIHEILAAHILVFGSTANLAGEVAGQYINCRFLEDVVIIGLVLTDAELTWCSLFSEAHLSFLQRHSCSKLRHFELERESRFVNRTLTELLLGPKLKFQMIHRV